MNTVQSIASTFICLLLCVSGCKRAAVSDVADKPNTADSAALSVALGPTLDCLPFYYAEASGIYDALGLNVDIRSFSAQFDRDTALLGTTADGIFSDLVRTQYDVAQGHNLSVVMSTVGQWSVVASGGSRIRSVSKLKKRMVGVARYSASDFYSEKVLSKAGLKYDDVFRPQVNDVSLRAAMLNESQIEAAVLPEPYATVARMYGHKVLHTIPMTQNVGCLTFNTKVLRNKRKSDAVKLLIEGYSRAVDSLNLRGKNVCRDVLRTTYQLTEQEIDSLQLYRYSMPALPSDTMVENTSAFLKRHLKSKRNGTAGLLLNNNYISR